MKGIASRNYRGLPVGAQLECGDNPGAKVVEIIAVVNYKGVKRRTPAAGGGERGIVTCKK